MVNTIKKSFEGLIADIQLIANCEIFFFTPNISLAY